MSNHASGINKDKDTKDQENDNTDQTQPNNTSTKDFFNIKIMSSSISIGKALEAIYEVCRGLRKNKKNLDQKYLWLFPSAVEAWKRMKYDSEEYVKSVKNNAALFRHYIDDVKHKIEQSRCCLVNLGSGLGDEFFEMDFGDISGELDSIKDIQALPILGKVIHVDLGLPFLSELISRYRYALEVKNSPINYAVEFVNADFLEPLDMHSIREDNPDSQFIWCLLGGTLANLREDKFLEQYANILQPKDKLVLGCYFCKDENSAKAQLRDNYYTENQTRYFFYSAMQVFLNGILLLSKYEENQKEELKEENENYIATLKYDTEIINTSTLKGKQKTSEFPVLSSMSLTITGESSIEKNQSNKVQIIDFSRYHLNDFKKYIEKQKYKLKNQEGGNNNAALNSIKYKKYKIEKIFYYDDEDEKAKEIKDVEEGHNGYCLIELSLDHV